MRDPNSPVCRTISDLLSRIGDKWSVLVVTTLGGGSRRFNELRREIPSVSQRMLTLTLRNLERDGLVSRAVTPTWLLEVPESMTWDPAPPQGRVGFTAPWRPASARPRAPREFDFPPARTSVS